MEFIELFGCEFIVFTKFWKMLATGTSKCFFLSSPVSSLQDYINASIRRFEVPPLTDALFILFLFLFFNHGQIYIANLYFNHFEVHNSVALSTFTLLCNDHHHLSLEVFHLPKLKL